MTTLKEGGKHKRRLVEILNGPKQHTSRQQVSETGGEAACNSDYVTGTPVIGIQIRIVEVVMRDIVSLWNS
jgi:hypothetical protein